MYHSLSKVGADFSQDFGVVEMSDSLHHGLGSLGWVTALEDARPHKDTVHSQLHQQTNICWSGWGEWGGREGDLSGCD